MAITDEDLFDRFPDVLIDHDNKYFYQGWLQKRLVFPRCNDCGTWMGEPRPICSSCWSVNLEQTEISGAGTIYMLIWLYQGPLAPGVDYAIPYPVVTVEFPEQPGLRFTSTVRDAAEGDVQIGDSVTLDWIDRYDAPFPVFRKAS